MRVSDLHSWDVTPAEAIAIQDRMRERILRVFDGRRVRLIAGTDITWDRVANGAYHGIAGVVVMRFPSLEVVEEATAAGDVVFPYVPGLLSFREVPLLLKAFEKLGSDPDLVLADGQGIAHPRRIGLASHLGLFLDVPTIGCAKSRLIGEYREPTGKRGSRTALQHRGEPVGVVLRTRDAVRPVFVSVGHRIDLIHAIRFTLRCSDGYRIPRPTRLAHQLVGRARVEQQW